MVKLQLKNVTLLGIDCIEVERLQVAMDICQKEIDFGEVKLLTSLSTDDSRKVEIPHIGSIEEFSRFCLEDLADYVDTEHVLLVQHDGFILNPKSWNNDFLSYDYIGAPWFVADWLVERFDFSESLLGTWVVGNGGFCLRSKKFLETSNRLFKEGKILKPHPEDIAVCHWYRGEFEKEGIRFAPPELAKSFSLEGTKDPCEKQFGFHFFKWTNIDKWIDDHPEYFLVVANYKKSKE